ncbi:MAG: hypothetical protein IT196_08205 [Acidimicrobiales bacterium]|nr:hypothetical protein [Acidimicrobiales bacterium]
MTDVTAAAPLGHRVDRPTIRVPAAVQSGRTIDPDAWMCHPAPRRVVRRFFTAGVVELPLTPWPLARVHRILFSSSPP